MLMNNKVVFFLMFFLLLYACSVEEEKNDNKTFIAKAGLANEYETSRQTLDAEISKNADNITALIARGNLALENYDFSNAFSDAARAFRLDRRVCRQPKAPPNRFQMQMWHLL